MQYITKESWKQQCPTAFFLPGSSKTPSKQHVVSSTYRGGRFPKMKEKKQMHVWIYCGDRWAAHQALSAVPTRNKAKTPWSNVCSFLENCKATRPSAITRQGAVCTRARRKTKDCGHSRGRVVNQVSKLRQGLIGGAKVWQGPLFMSDSYNPFPPHIMCNVSLCRFNRV